jgi:hypothetical protein
MRAENGSYQKKPQPAAYTQRHNNTRRLESHGSTPPIDAKSIAQRQSLYRVDKPEAARRVKKFIIPAFRQIFQPASQSSALRCMILRS